MQKTYDYDVVIVGAGIIGSLTAYYLQEYHPVARILLIDKSMISTGATHYSLGAVYPFASNSEKRLLTQESAALWPELQKFIPYPEQKRPFYAVMKKKELEWIEASFIDFQHFLKQEEIQSLKEKLPWLEPVSSNTSSSNAHDELIWLLGGEASQHHPESITISLCRFLRTHQNIHVVEGVKIVDFTLENEEVSVTTSTQQKIRARQLCFAAGPWLPALLGKDQNNVNIRTKKIVSVHLESTPNSSDPMIYLLDEEAFLIPNLKDKRWELSFKSKEFDVSPDINQLYLGQEEITAASYILERHAKPLMTQIRGGRVFCDAYGPDLTPLAIPFKAYPNVIIAGAGSGIGFRLAPSIAKRAASLLQSNIRMESSDE